MEHQHELNGQGQRLAAAEQRAEDDKRMRSNACAAIVIAQERIADLESKLSTAQARIETLKTDAHLGRLVRQMPRGSCLQHYSGSGLWTCIDRFFRAKCDTPEAALAHLEEGDVNG
jgi:predicted RNase H-like nuclease (RuvC/YqgF family)